MSAGIVGPAPVILYDANGNPIVLGQAAKAASYPVVMPSDQWPDAIARAIFASLTDGTTGPAKIQPASGTPSSADLALTVSLSPNSNGLAGNLANGAVGDPKPVIVGGRDGTNVRTIATDAQGQVKVVVQQPSGALPLTLNYHDALAVAGAQVNQFYSAVKYTVPTGYKYVASLYNAASEDNRVTARISKFIQLGAWNLGTQVFTAGSSYSSPLFASYLEAEVTTTLGNVDDTTLSVTYTNQDGVSGRTGTSFNSLRKLMPSGFKVRIVLQAGDYGVRSVQAVAYGDVKTNTGVIALLGGIGFWRQGMPTPDQNFITVPGVGTNIVSAGEIMELAFSSSGAATSQRQITAVGTLQVAS
jgi:hypothetical protein